MEANLSHPNLWWINLVQCPACGNEPSINNSIENQKCQSCNNPFKLINNQIDWTPENENTQRYDYPKNKWVFLKRGLNPLNNPLLPFRYWSNFKTNQYYERTLNDKELAESWEENYLSGIKLPKDATILDHGCGRGRNIGLLNQKGFKVVGQEMNENNWWKNFDKNGFQILPPNIANSPWKDSSFDLVTDIMVVGYLPRETLNFFVKEIRRVLKPGGFWLILETNDEGLGKKFFPEEKLLPLKLMRTFAKEHNFREIDVTYEGFYAPFFPMLINYIRKQCGPWPFEVTDYNSWIAKQIPPRKRGLWVMRLKCLKNE